MKRRAPRNKEGVDVVVGIVETHGRQETEALLDGLEMVPRRRTLYKERWLEEWTLTQSSCADPQLVLVDELAHTNAPGSRHPKRYSRCRGVCFGSASMSTPPINIQHIESLNDVVAQITGVRVRETVPDSIFDRANAVELVDLTPDDLIQRLKDGKVYVPEQAERALEHFFSPANLTALRELALRRTAERVDEQLLDEMQARAIPGPWAAGERLLDLREEDPRSSGLVRYTKRLSTDLHAPWTALYVEGRRSVQLSEDERDRIAATLRLAQSAWRRACDNSGRRTELSRTMSSRMRAPTTSPRSSSANRHGHAGSRFLTARSCTTWFGVLAISVCTSSRVTSCWRTVTGRRASRLRGRARSLNAARLCLCGRARTVALGVGKLLWP